MRRSLAEKARQRLRYLSPQQPAGSPSTEPANSLSQYRDDPVRFALEVFGVELWDGQQEICVAAAHHDAAACKSGHKCGKSTAAAVLAWWFAATRSSARVIVTAPTDRQVKQVVWREIRRLWRLAVKRGNPYSLPEPALAPDTGISLPEDSQVLGFTAANQEAMAGISSPEMLYIVDEASGVDEKIFEAIEGNLAGGAKIILISNPTQTSGQFFRAFHKEQAEWKLVSISSEDTPNAKSGKKLVPGLATKEWIEKRKRVWGVEDPRYQVRVKGNFPRQASNSIVSIGALEAAKERWAEASPEGELRIGLDVARFGDDSSVAQAVRGLLAYEPRSVNGFDTIQVAGMVLEIVRDPKMRPPGTRARIRIDAGGGYGGGVADQLRYVLDEDDDLRDWVTVEEVHPSSGSDDPQYDLKRDELWFGVRDWLEAGGALPEHDELEGDLLAPTYSFTRRGSKIKVEAKDEIKKRLGRSPDFADALALAVSDADSAPMERPDLSDGGSRWDDYEDGDGRGF